MYMYKLYRHKKNYLYVVKIIPLFKFTKRLNGAHSTNKMRSELLKYLPVYRTKVKLINFITPKK